MSSTLKKAKGQLSDEEIESVCDKVRAALKDQSNADGLLLIVSHGVVDPTFTTRQPGIASFTIVKRPETCAMVIFNQGVIFNDVKDARALAAKCMEIGGKSLHYIDSELSHRSKRN